MVSGLRPILLTSVGKLFIMFIIVIVVQNAKIIKRHAGVPGLYYMTVDVFCANDFFTVSFAAHKSGCSVVIQRTCSCDICLFL